MPNDNLKIWDRLGKTDPAHTKGFKRAGGFSGTAIKPIYTAHKMTETFGPAGKGWGMGRPEFQVVPGHNGEVLVYCTVELWWTEGGDTPAGTVYGVGGDKAVSHVKANEQYNRPERWENDDEAFKKAFTDAVGNAMKHLGMSADVHMGLFEDSKYVNAVRRELAEEASAEPLPEPAPKLLGKGPAREADGAMRKAIDDCRTVEELAALWLSRSFQADLKRHPLDWQKMMVQHKAAKLAELQGEKNTSSEPTDHLDRALAENAAYAASRAAPNFDHLDPSPSPQ